MIVPGRLASSYVALGDPRQVQPAGVDIRVDVVERLAAEGVLGVESRSIPEGDPLPLESGWWRLGPGAYRVRFLDPVKVPPNAAGLCFPRSSLLRMGASLHCAVWDPGYEGRGQALLTVYNPHGIRLEWGARIAQMVFIRLEKPPEKLYSGAYQGEGIRDN